MTDYSALTIDQVLYIHDKIIEAAGGKHGIRDFTLLHSALERCKVTFDGEDLYETVFEKASALLHSLVMNHAFLDGNKRTAYEVMKWFLHLNGYEMIASQKEIIRFCISVDNDGVKTKEIALWLKKNTAKS